MKAGILVICVVGGLLAGCSKTSVEQASREFNELPPAVQQTTRARVPNAEVVSVRKHNRDGPLVYEIRFRDGDRQPPIQVAEDGTLVRYAAGTAGGGFSDEQGSSRGGGGSDISALPVAVQQAIRTNTPRADVVSIHRTEEDGRTIYEIEFAGREENPRLRVAEDGSLLRPTR